MFGFIIGVVVGLIVGWNFLDQPVWVRAKIYELKVRTGLVKDNDFNPDN